MLINDTELYGKSLNVCGILTDHIHKLFTIIFWNVLQTFPWIILWMISCIWTIWPYELSLTKWRPLLEFYEAVLDLHYNFQRFGVSKIYFRLY